MGMRTSRRPSTRCALAAERPDAGRGRIEGGTRASIGAAAEIAERARHGAGRIVVGDVALRDELAFWERHRSSGVILADAPASRPSRGRWARAAGAEPSVVPPMHARRGGPALMRRRCGCGRVQRAGQK
jgi:hypothetical protein